MQEKKRGMSMTHPAHSKAACSFPKLPRISIIPFPHVSSMSMRPE